MISEKGLAEFAAFVNESIGLPEAEQAIEPEPEQDNRPAPIGEPMEFKTHVSNKLKEDFAEAMSKGFFSRNAGQ